MIWRVWLFPYLKVEKHLLCLVVEKIFLEKVKICFGYFMYGRVINDQTAGFTLFVLYQIKFGQIFVENYHSHLWGLVGLIIYGWIFDYNKTSVFFYFSNLLVDASYLTLSGWTASIGVVEKYPKFLNYLYGGSWKVCGNSGILFTEFSENLRFQFCIFDGNFYGKYVIYI